MKLNTKDVVENFENWKTIGPIASIYTGENKKTKLEELFLSRNLPKGILLSPKVLEEVQQERRIGRKLSSGKQNLVLTAKISFYGYVQERAFRATVQGLAKNFGVIVESIENENKNKEKVNAVLKGREHAIHNLIRILEKPHIVAHSRTGNQKLGFGEHIYIMAFSERNLLQGLEAGFQFINMVTSSTIHE